MGGVGYPGNLACPSCGGTDTGVMDSRGTPEGWIRRRRRCNGCGERMTTYELNADELEATLREIRAIRVASVALAKLIEGLPANRTKSAGTLNSEPSLVNGADNT
jgi:transcriptional regulator NrdR family protein